MSVQNIYNLLRNAGMSHAGACGMMGNMYCESLLQSNNVEDRCHMTDNQYTDYVDSGSMPLVTFQSDAYGYGLCQWTFWTRKRDLYKLAKERGVSISDEALQCDFCVRELKNEYASLWNYLQTTTDIYTAVSRICTEYERPAVNNINARYTAALNYQNLTVTETSSEIIQNEIKVEAKLPEFCEVTLPILRKGDCSRAVYLAQCGLNDMGYNTGTPDGAFGAMTASGLNRFKASHGLKMDCTVDSDVWKLIFDV